MELFGVEKQNDETFGGQIEENDFYNPQLTKVELRRMEDVTSPFTKKPKISLPLSNYKNIRETLPLTSRIRPSSCKVLSSKRKGKKNSKSINQPKNSIPTLSVNLNVPDEAKSIYNAVSDYLSSKPISNKVKRILETQPPYINFHKQKLKTEIRPKNNSPGSHRSHASTRYDSSCSSLTSPALTRRLHMERQMFMISQYANISAEDIRKFNKSLNRHHSSEVKIQKSEDSSSEESLNLDFEAES